MLRNTADPGRRQAGHGAGSASEASAGGAGGARAATGLVTVRVSKQATVGIMCKCSRGVRKESGGEGGDYKAADGIENGQRDRIRGQGFLDERTTSMNILLHGSSQVTTLNYIYADSHEIIEKGMVIYARIKL